VVNLMEALRASVGGKPARAASARPVKKAVKKRKVG
jgi:non-homologous end joining protein Ku